MNDQEIVHPSNDLTDENYSNIEKDENQHEWTNQNNSFYTLVDNELQSSSHLEDPNQTNDCKTVTNHEGDLVMAHNTNAERSTLYLETFYTLYIGPNNNCIRHSIFKLSTR